MSRKISASNRASQRGEPRRTKLLDGMRSNAGVDGTRGNEVRACCRLTAGQGRPSGLPMRLSHRGILNISLQGPSREWFQLFGSEGPVKSSQSVACAFRTDFAESCALRRKGPKADPVEITIAGFGLARAIANGVGNVAQGGLQLSARIQSLTARGP